MSLDSDDSDDKQLFSVIEFWRRRNKFWVLWKTLCGRHNKEIETKVMPFFIFKLQVNHAQTTSATCDLVDRIVIQSWYFYCCLTHSLSHDCAARSRSFTLTLMTESSEKGLRTLPWKSYLSAVTSCSSEGSVGCCLVLFEIYADMMNNYTFYQPVIFPSLNITLCSLRGIDLGF